MEEKIHYARRNFSFATFETPCVFDQCNFLNCEFTDQTHVIRYSNLTGCTGYDNSELYLCNVRDDAED